MAKKVIAAAGGSVRGKSVAVLGLTFKPNTDDMRDSPAIAIIQALQDAGAHVRAYDPEGVEQAKLVLHNVDYAENAYAALTGADVAVLVTEWDAFRALDLGRVARPDGDAGDGRPAQRLSARRHWCATASPILSVGR